MAAGRKRDRVWEYFNEVPLPIGKPGMRAKCKQCNKEMQGLVARMKQHREKCCDERTMFEEAGPSGETTINIKDSGNYPLFKSPSSCSKVSEFSLQNSASVTSFTHIHNISPKRKKPSGTTTIDKFVIKTSRLEKELIDEKIARFVYATNSSFRLLENPHFVNMIQSLRPGYSPPSRLDVAGKLLDKVYDEEMMQCTTSVEGKIVNLSLDGWSNVHNDPIVYACISTEEGNVFLAETIDASGNAHTAAYLEEVAAKVIITCEKKFKCQVRSLVTDNAANVSKMRRNLEQHEETTKLITYGCSAHLMHLLAKDFCVPEIKSNVVEIAKYFRNNHFAASALKIMGGTKLTLPQDVMWNSLVDCFEQYIKNWPILMTVCEQNREKIDGTITAKTLNIGLKRNVEYMLSILKPVSEALNKIQKNSCFIADAVDIWKELSEHLKTELHKQKLQDLKKRMGQALSPAHFLANIVNIRHQGQTLSAEEEELAMTWVSSNHPSLLPTIMNFRAKGEPFKKYMFTDEVLKKVSPVNWWKSVSLKHLDSESVEVIISLLTAVASSAGIERIFSSFGLDHSKLRNHLGPDKAGKLVFLFHIMNKQENEDENE